MTQGQWIAMVVIGAVALGAWWKADRLTRHLTSAGIVRPQTTFTI